jgi:hypothetical protein
MRRMFLAMIFLVVCAVSPLLAEETAEEPWYFAVSGDSRDCGDLIMPKIARDVEAHRATTPARFYWHLGDFRRLYGPDCDVAKRSHPDWNCAKRPEGELGFDEMNQYLDLAWDDFLERQIAPFGETTVFLGIGNHELAAGRTRGEFRRQFQPWLTSAPIHLQRVKEAAMDPPFYSTEGDTYYHFIERGVDFIYLDNADSASFSAAQITWLQKVLKNDQADPSVKTLVVGMHEALPYSKQRGHAMDAACQGLCSGQQVYNMLYRAQNLAKPEARKHVYVFASHSHLFVEDAFNQPEHAGQVLPGWIVGTAGAEQYRAAAEPIQYGYVLAKVLPDGELEVTFREVTRDSPPQATGPGAEPLTDFCFNANKQEPKDSAFTGTCACGQAQP